MTKFVSSLIIGSALATASLSAAELKHEVTPNVQSVMFGHESKKEDLLSIATNGALTEQSEGVYVLSALEMQEVQGGSRIGKWARKHKTRIKYGVLSGVVTVATGGAAGAVVLNAAAGAATKKLVF